MRGSLAIWGIRGIRGWKLAAWTAAATITTPTWAALIAVPDVAVVEGTPEVEIPILISSSPAEAIKDLVLRVQVEDGGPEVAVALGNPGGGIDGPSMTKINFADSVFASKPFSHEPSAGLGVTDPDPADNDAPGQFPQLIEYNVNLINAGDKVEANGTLAKVKFDLTGFVAGQVFNLYVSNTVAGPTEASDGNQPGVVPLSLTFDDGSITLQPIPEPATLTLLGMGALALCRRQQTRS